MCGFNQAQFNIGVVGCITVKQGVSGRNHKAHIRVSQVTNGIAVQELFIIVKSWLVIFFLNPVTSFTAMEVKLEWTVVQLFY